MRQDPGAFAVLNTASAKEPRFVISIEYDVESVYLTSHDGIDAVPGVVINNVLQEPSAISQRIVPDEGRSEIGTFNFSLVDVESAFTDEIRDKLQDNKGLRGKTVRFYLGYRIPSGEVAFGGFGGGPFGGTGYGSAVPGYTPPDATFTDFQLFQTQIVKSASYIDGTYRIQCNDITREQKKDIFEPKRTTLRASITASSTTVLVGTTTDFNPVAHGTSWSDAPSATAGYIRIDKEIVRYTGKTVDSFTGCTRGALNTKAVAHEVDPAAEAERRPKVEEVIYLELPAVMAAYAIQTGLLGVGSSNSIPAHWHLGIDPDLIRDTDFTGIGKDLWDTADDSAGFICRFQDLKKIDGKKFLESEIYQLIGVHQVIYADGTIGIKRMNQVLSDSAFVVTLDETNVVEAGELLHDLDGMINSFQIDWNWNGEEFTRRTLFADAQSVAAHGASKLKTLAFKGLHGSRHTAGIIRKRLDAFRDRYAEPPQRITVSVLPSLNPLEIGDIVRLQLPNVRDYAGTLSSIDRSFEIQNKSEDFRTGNVSLELFGSTARPSTDPPTGAGTALPDAFYTAVGTELSTVVTIVVVGGVGVIQSGTYNLTGNANLNNAGAIYYYAGDLELSSAAVLTINNNVQLRVRGFFTINGDIDGIGRGIAGVADSGGPTSAVMGTPGFLGNSRGMDGLKWYPLSRGGAQLVETRPTRLTRGKYASFPFHELRVSGNNLLGLPDDLRGTSGGPGEKVVGITDAVEANGGTGAASGAGLAIICRGLAFGASGSVTLSGNSSAATSLVDNVRADRSYPGSGGAGAPGGFFIGLDGGSISLPDLGGKFIAATGSVPIQGNPITVRERHNWRAAFEQPPFAGFLDESYISGFDMSNAAYRIQYIPGVETPQVDQDRPPSPSNLLVASGAGFNEITVVVNSFSPFDTAEVYGSITNNRTNAVLVGEGRQTEFKDSVPGYNRRYYWARTKKLDAVGNDLFSEWFPVSSTAGVTGIAIDVGSSVATDGEFQLATDTSYWYVGTGSGNLPTIELTGGNISGRAIFDFNQGAQFVVSRRNPPRQAVTGELWTIKLRWRRRGTVTGFGLVRALMYRHDQPPTNSSFNFSGVTAATGGIYLDEVEIAAATVDVWQEAQGVSLVVAPSAYVGGDLPYLSLVLDTESNLQGTNFEADLLDAFPGAGGNLRRRTFTSGQTIAFRDAFHVCGYDSASGGTLTLPTVTSVWVGVKIYFEQVGAGLLTIGAPGAGLLLSPPNTTGNRALSGRYAQAVAEARGSDWILSGSLA